jgi:hypothetical protein
MRRWIIYLLRRWDGRIYALSLNVYKVVVVRIDETTHSPSTTAVLNNIFPTQTSQYSQNHVAINQSTTKESCGQQPHTRLSSAPRLDLDSHSPYKQRPQRTPYPLTMTLQNCPSELPSRFCVNRPSGRGSTNIKPVCLVEI